MNTTIPLFRCTVTDIMPEPVPAQIHAAYARDGQALLFHAHLESGANYTGVRVDQMYHKMPTSESLPLSLLQPFGCLSGSLECFVLGLFKNQRVYCHYLGIWGKYVMSFDFMEGQYVDMPEEFKQYHLIALDSGQYCLHPNNYLLFQDKVWTGKLSGEVPKGIKRLGEFRSPEN